MFGFPSAQLVPADLSPGQATALITAAATTGISAAGTNQATATVLTTSMNLVATASTSQGVSLPSTFQINDAVLVYNDATGVSIFVYPDSASNKINQLAAGNGILVPNNTGAIFIKVSSTRWVANVSA